MLFYYIEINKKSLPSKAEYPCFALEEDQWDDYGYVLQYYLSYWETSQSRIEIGNVKIAKIGKAGNILKETSLPKVFSSLSDRYFSLGQEWAYYENIIKFNDHTEILASLNDISQRPDVIDKFESDKGFKDGIIRFSEAKDNINRAAEVLGNITVKKKYFNLDFNKKILGFENPHVLKIQFKKKDILPHRIVGFIGKNGSGKTAVMSGMANIISGIEKNEENFLRIPEFSRLLVVSLSPFGPFKFPSINTSSYRYFGLRGKADSISRDFINLEIKKSLDYIIGKDLLELLWQGIQHSNISNSEPIFNSGYDEDVKERILNSLDKLSSGNFCLIGLIIFLVGNLNRDSLLMLDEPELYLHPNTLSGLMRAIDFLLSRPEFSSYAIIATHSPIVVQEIPGKYVFEFKRIDDSVAIKEVDFETFGENLQNITYKIFGVDSDSKNYLSRIRELLAEYSTEEVKSAFGKILSYNAESAIVNSQNDMRRE